MPENPRPNISEGGQFQRGEQVASERGFSIHRADLKGEVRTYAENLWSQIEQIYQEAGVSSPEEYLQKAQRKEITLPDLERLEALYRQLQVAYKTGEIPPNAEYPESTLEKALSLREQYQEQLSLLSKLGLTQELPDAKTQGLISIDGKEYALPSYRIIQERLRAKETLLARKAEQGFTKLLIVPFGRKLLDLAKLYHDQLILHFDQGKLLGQNGDPLISDRDFDRDNPLYLTDSLYATKPGSTPGTTVPDKSRGADETGELVYFPKEFSSNHKGQTKQELLDQEGGFLILLVNPDPIIPRQDQGLSQADRIDLEAGIQPQQYLAKLQDQNPTNPYHQESGLTPEIWLIQALLRLETKNQVLDDFQAKGSRGREFTSINYLLGAFNPAAGGLFVGCWDRDLRKARLNWGYPTRQESSIGARAAVRV